MGRRIPINGDDDFQVIHPVLTLTLLFAGMAATISMIMALCIRRKSSSPPKTLSTSSPEFKTSEVSSSGLYDNPQQQPAMTSGETTTTMVRPTTQATSTLESQYKTENDGLQNKELPLPPAMMTSKESQSSNNLTRSMSTRKVTTFMGKKSLSTRKSERSLSIKLPRSLSAMGQDREDKNGKKGKLKHEDSIWTKTIILGEKCKVSDEDDDAIIYENKGNRISAYHKKTQSTMSLSRQTSHVEPNAILGQEDDKEMVTNEQVSVS